MKVKITEPNDGVVIESKKPGKKSVGWIVDDEYQLFHDTATGDWLVTSTTDNGIMEDYFLDKQSAINYVLQRLEIIIDADYNRAPDRTSA